MLSQVVCQYSHEKVLESTPFVLLCVYMPIVLSIVVGVAACSLANGGVHWPLEPPSVADVVIGVLFLFAIIFTLIPLHYFAIGRAFGGSNS